MAREKNETENLEFLVEFDSAVDSGQSRAAPQPTAELTHAVTPETQAILYERVQRASGLLRKDLGESRERQVQRRQQVEAATKGMVSMVTDRQPDKTELLLGEEVTEALVTTEPATEDALEPPRAEVELEVQIGASNFLPAWFLQVGAARLEGVCKVETSGVDYRGRSGSWVGTGFLVSRNILLTNHHVINSRDAAVNAVCVFDYQTDERGRILPTRAYRLNPSRLFLTSPATGGLDFTFVWVDANPGDQQACFPIDRSAFQVRNGDRANIIQHPGGRPKAVVLQENTVRRQDARVVHYTSDTEGGSSGSGVCNNQWKLTGLHHAARMVKPASNGTPAQYLNEAVKLSAIAAHLEAIAQVSPERAAADEVLALFHGTDANLGFFGGLGRQRGATTGLESVTDAYEGDAKDLDVGFWNIEWFNRRFASKLDDVAALILEMNLDVWALIEASPESTAALVKHLNEELGADYAWAASEPTASSGKQTTTVIWNRRTVVVERRDWPRELDRAFRVDSRDFASLHLEAVEGRVFNRYPGLFHIRTTRREAELGLTELDFFLVPVHLKAKGEGWKRRRMASKILAYAVGQMIADAPDGEKEYDWIVGGDFNAELASGDFDALREDFVPLSAEDERDGHLTYIKGRYRSLIDHIFLSRNLAQVYGEDDFFIVAKDRSLDDFLRLSDHRPVLCRLALADAPAARGSGVVGELPAALVTALRRADAEPAPEPSAPPAPRGVTTRYYDGRADRADRDAYYPEGLLRGSRSEVYASLSALLVRTHENVLPYRPREHVYPEVDVHPDGMLRSIYSGVVAAPEAFIAADLELETARERMALVLERETRHLLESRGVDLETLLEALGPYNCEHVVPQSWYDRDQPMRGDLHHLFACEPRCNSFRGNRPYYDWEDWEEAVRDGCGRSDDNRFEPGQGKGAVARATLYFLVRYPGVITDSSRHYRAAGVETLLAWHQAHPPDAWERHRNAVIFRKQGNRNPLIDLPEIASRVDFHAGLGRR